MSRLASPAEAAATGRLLRCAAATAAALGRTAVITFSPDSPRLDTCIAYLPSAAGLAPSLAASFSRNTSIALAAGAEAPFFAPSALAVFAGSAAGDLRSSPALASPFLSSGRLPAVLSASSFSDDGCDELPRHSAPLAAIGFFSIGTAPMAVASGAPVSPRLRPILKPGDVGPNWATTTAAPGSAARATPASPKACRAAEATRESRNRDDMGAPHGRCAPL